MPKLGVNIDHIATLRQARREFEPDPILAAEICEKAGADSIVAHLREDRRHINDKDIKRLRKSVRTMFNMEMSINKDIVDVAVKIKPDQVTLVPEKRKELTTEGGLDVANNFKSIKKAVSRLADKGIEISLFIDPAKEQIDSTKDLGVNVIELHTGKYAIAKNRTQRTKELNILKKMTEYALRIGLTVNAGHGLKYDNTKAVAEIPGINELNIGHSIISYAVIVGLEKAVKDMMLIIKGKK